ncbi:MAG: alpha/beta hydrolase [Promethearchaeota archaeon]|nr:MAG: alpha/beta hydrolase [Candidatus Lokiarchaeota archaeon]
MVSKGMEFVIKTIRERNAQDIKERVQKSREALEDLAKLVKVPKDVKIQKVDIDGMPAEWISAPGTEEDKVVLYLHGGGYISGSINSHRELVSSISRVSKARILIIDYRLAPEHPFPAAVEDSTKAFKWLIENQQINPRNIIIAGDSAGGGLTFATLLNLRDNGMILPVAAIGLSPWTDLGITGETYKTKIKEDPMVSLDGIIFDAILYLGDTDYKNPLASPLYANLNGLPPILILVGTAELLLDDSRRFAERAKHAGIDITLDIWDDMLHVFPAFAAFAPEGQKGIEKMGEFIKKYLS